MRYHEFTKWFCEESTCDVEITRHVSDSRDVCPGAVFYALKGEKTDGHLYLQQVKEAGAIAAVVSSSYQGESFGLRLFYVDDVISKVQQIAKEYAASFSDKVIIGVTGSVGKTTTKEFLATLLSKKFRVAKNPRSFNSQVTFPMTVLNLIEKGDLIVLEMAMSDQGQIAKLVDIAPPHIAVLTPITYCHSEFFNSIHEIARAKAEIFSSKRLAYAAISEESYAFEDVKSAVQVPYAVYSARENEKKWKFPFTATHLIEDAMGAIAAARYLGMTDAEIQLGLDDLKPYDHRFQVRRWNGAIFVDDSYNANPKSMIAALENLPKPGEQGKVFGVLGSMGELGDYEEKGHQIVGEKAYEVLTELLCIGKECSSMMDAFSAGGKKAQLFSNYDTIREYLLKEVRSGDVVLVKGSNFHKLWEVISFID